MAQPVQSKNAPSLASSIPEGTASLDSILCTEELQLRPSRPPDHAKENAALVALASAIRALFKQAAIQKIGLDLNEVIVEVLHLLTGETARKRVAVETDLAQDLRPVMGDRVQLQQLVFNLLLNVIEALDPVVDRPRKLFICSKQSGPETVLVEVWDCGVGTQDPDRIFEAFFTTKENGMGMGLAICRSIIDAHQGRLWAVSGEGPGTIFTFTLPAEAGVA